MGYALCLISLKCFASDRRKVLAGFLVDYPSMLSGLYGDLPEAKNNAAQNSSDSGGWAAKPKFAPPNRKSSTFGAPRSVLGAAKKTQKDHAGKCSLMSAKLKYLPSKEVGHQLRLYKEATGMPFLSDRCSKRSKVPASQPLPFIGKPPLDPARRSGTAQTSGSLPIGGSGLLNSARVEEQFSDEYDPARPNEYEAIRRDKERVREEAQQEADRLEELRLLQVNDLCFLIQDPAWLSTFCKPILQRKCLDWQNSILRINNNFVNGNIAALEESMYDALYLTIFAEHLTILGYTFLAVGLNGGAAIIRKQTDWQMRSQPPLRMTGKQPSPSAGKKPF